MVTTYLTISLVLSIVSNVIAVAFLIRTTIRLKLLAKGYPDFEDYRKFKRDLHAIGGSMLEFRRVDPDNVFIRS